YQFKKKGELEQALVTSETEMQIVKLIKDFVSDPANKNELVPATLTGSGQGQGTDNFVGAYNNLILKRIELMQNAHAGNAALEAIDRQIEAMRKNLLSTVDKTYQSSALKVREIRNEMNAAQTALGNMPTQERQFRDIKRQQSIKEQLYLFLLKQREQTSMMLANSSVTGQIIDEAYALNEPLGMKKSVKLIVAFFCGLVLAGGYLYVRRMLRDKFDSSEELAGITSVPVLGEMCTSSSGEALVVKPGGSTSAAELFRLIRTNLQFMLGGNGHKVVLVTSTTSGEGKSFISINLASSLALLGKKVLLVGLDIRKPKLQQYLGLPAGRGFTEYISSGDMPLESIIRRNVVMPGLDVITSGPVPPNPSELLADARVDELFEKLRGMYDYIIVDSAPVGIVSDTLSLVRISDATIYVCRVNYTTRRDIASLNSFHAADRFRKLAVVVNGTRPRRTYGYGEDSDSTRKKRL
ncbi:MAG: polysaccharide biosynthesis tyrosine autokinase, partial [Muribaculaceae bacterium]|nr:polysaccharide biosynthesis tyrosine autokinase [Muribaculaceae bacterium]